MKDKQMVDDLSVNNEIEAKRKGLIALKQTLDHNREILQAKVNKKHFNDAKRREEILAEQKLILERGENPNFFVPRKIRMEETEKAKK